MNIEQTTEGRQEWKQFNLKKWFGHSKSFYNQVLVLSKS